MDVWNACALEPNSAIRWMECHPGTAGYVQAAGLIATVATALLGPPISARYRSRKHRQMLRRNSDELVFSQVPDIASMRYSVGRLLEKLPTMSLAFIDGRVPDEMRIVIPGHVDPNLLRSPRRALLDLDRLAVVFDFVEEVRSYNQAVFTTTEDEFVADDLRRVLKKRLEGLLAARMRSCT